MGLLIGFVALVCAPVAGAAPVTDLSSLPAGLQKYVPGSQAFAGSPWMTSPTCKQHGGDFSIWATNVVQDTPSLLTYFQANVYGPGPQGEDKARADETLQGYRDLAGRISQLLPTGYPAYCVDDMKRWAGPDPAMKPFGFPWGVTKNDGHQSMYHYCTDRADPNSPVENEYNRFFGAERAPCDAFYVSCNNAQESEKARCEAWNTFSDQYVRQVEQLRGKAIDDHPATSKADTHTEVKSPTQIASDIAGGWFVSLTTTIAQGAASMLSSAMSFWTNTSTLQSPAIAQIQNMLRYVGIVLLLGSVIWQGIRLIYTRKIDPLVSTGMGLLSFVGWSTLGGTLAVLLNEAGAALASQVLHNSITDFSNAVSSSLIAQAQGAAGAMFFLAIILFFLACIQWVLGFFRMGALVILLALLPTAAAGQANEATKPWLRKVLSWCLTLILYQPVAAIIFALGAELMGKG